MYPLEMKFDKNNVGYIDINNVFIEKKQFINQDYDSKKIIPMKKDFYITSSHDYLLKVNKDKYDHDKYLYEFVKSLIEKQSSILKVSFPIGIVLNNEYVIGQIIKYYNNSITLRDIFRNEQLEGLQKYIYRDEDSLHNLFLVYLEVLDILEELFENGIVYLDVHDGNFVIWNNKVKIIDFEYGYTKFDKIKHYEHIILHNYIITLKDLIGELGINTYYDCLIDEKEFSKIRTKVKQFENTIRKNK